MRGDPMDMDFDMGGGGRGFGGPGGFHYGTRPPFLAVALAQVV